MIGHTPVKMRNAFSSLANSTGPSITSHCNCLSAFFSLLLYFATSFIPSFFDFLSAVFLAPISRAPRFSYFLKGSFLALYVYVCHSEYLSSLSHFGLGLSLSNYNHCLSVSCFTVCPFPVYRSIPSACLSTCLSVCRNIYIYTHTHVHTRVYIDCILSLCVGEIPQKALQKLPS